MRYEKGHKDTTRKHIIDVAARRFRNDGVAAAGLAGIMTDAGLTNGAFYTHFSSKDDLVCETLTAALDKMRQRILAAEGDGAIRDYLSTRHRDHPETGCPTSALVAEIARLPRKTRAIYTERVAKLFELMASRFAEGSEQERRRRAMALYGLMIGTLQLARAVCDKKLSDEILENGLQTALAIAGRPTDGGPSKP
ncbi:TetR/AcrR family transcriptional regulator [Bradyrhizobium prioriisuperbiae]|uniref:TetR/AcrR family transcriptional regulator n=1 Tax=Bradyrhizobium prioriisuperbiae TaxID=2854389 RepID=UPI0028EA4F2D|nr:TetR/AcrR family transcriptional regulator [Bradyrhizobium prioritasuperba]